MISTADSRTIRRGDPNRLGAVTLKEAVETLEKVKRPFKLSGRPHGGYVISTNELHGRTKVMSFRHPTKRVTPGRVAFLTVA